MGQDWSIPMAVVMPRRMKSGMEVDVHEDRKFLKLGRKYIRWVKRYSNKRERREGRNEARDI